jgi:hypothetical protein
MTPRLLAGGMNDRAESVGKIGRSNLPSVQDIGGVLLTNGWTHDGRQRAAANFSLDLAEMEDRHHLTFDTYEEGKLTLDVHTDYTSTRAQLDSLGFTNSDHVTHDDS